MICLPVNYPLSFKECLLHNSRVFYYAMNRAQQPERRWIIISLMIPARTGLTEPEAWLAQI